MEILQDAKTRPARRTQEDAGTSCWAPWGTSWRTSPPSRTFRGARADNLVLDVKISRTSQAQRCEIQFNSIQIQIQERLEAAVRGGADNYTLHRDDRGGEECRRSVRWERKGPGSAVDRLLDIFHIKITHLLAKTKFRYFCNATFVLMYYLVLHCVSSCLVFGRECNDDQSLLI